MRPFVFIILSLFAASGFLPDARASAARHYQVAAPSSEALKAANCGCGRQCGPCSYRYTVYRACGACGCGGCPAPYRFGYGYAGYGCGCGTGRCTCSYCSHGCGKEGWYGYPGGYPGCGNCGCNGCRYYSYTTTRCGGCNYGGYGYYPGGYYNGGWSVFGWLF